MDSVMGVFVNEGPSVDRYDKDWGFHCEDWESRSNTNGRRERRKAKLEANLRQVYKRLTEFSEADVFVDELFSRLSISRKFQDEYRKTHRIIGPGATIARDFVSVWVSPGELRRGETTGPVRAYDDTNTHSLENFLKETWYFSKFGGMVDDIAELSICDPEAAAKQAQSVMRRAGYTKAVVSSREFSRSRNSCAKTIEKFSKEVPRYDDQIRSYIDKNWVQLIGPGGLGDWEIAAPLSMSVAARDLYSIVTAIGYEYALLLFDNEVNVMNITLVPAVGFKRTRYTDVYEFEPYCEETDNVTSLADDGSESPGKVTFRHDEVFLSLDAGIRRSLEDSALCLSPISTGSGKGCKVHLGANTSITASHIMECASKQMQPYCTDLGNGLTAIVEVTREQPAWRFREPIIGEVCVIFHLYNNCPMLSEKVVVSDVDVERNYVLTGKPSGIRKGDSGCALVSCVDLSLLGILQGSSSADKRCLVFSKLDVQTFWSLSFSDCEAALSLNALEKFTKSGLRNRLLDIIKTLSRNDEGKLHMKVSPHWLYSLEKCEPNAHDDQSGASRYETAALALKRYRFPVGLTYHSSLTVRAPKLSEGFVLLGYSDGSSDCEFSNVGNITCVNSDGGFAMYSMGVEVDFKISCVVSTVDAALIGLNYKEEPGRFNVLTGDFLIAEKELVLPSDSLGFIADSELLSEYVRSDVKNFLKVWRVSENAPTWAHTAADQTGAVSVHRELMDILGGDGIVEAVNWAPIAHGLTKLMCVHEDVMPEDILARLVHSYKFFERGGLGEEFKKVLRFKAIKSLVS